MLYVDVRSKCRTENVEHEYCCMYSLIIMRLVICQHCTCTHHRRVELIRGPAVQCEKSNGPLSRAYMHGIACARMRTRNRVSRSLAWVQIPHALTSIFPLPHARAHTRPARAPARRAPHAYTPRSRACLAAQARTRCGVRAVCGIRTPHAVRCAHHVRRVRTHAVCCGVCAPRSRMPASIEISLKLVVCLRCARHVRRVRTCARGVVRALTCGVRAYLVRRTYGARAVRRAQPPRRSVRALGAAPSRSRPSGQ